MKNSDALEPVRRKLLTLGMTASVCAAIPFARARAQSANTLADLKRKPVTLIVPFAPGGGSDSIARELAKHLSAQLGVTIIVDNKGGAGGAIAATAVAKAVPDGSTLLFTTSTFVTHAASDPAPVYDPLKDFAPVAMLGRGPLLVVSSKASGITSIEQLIARAKAKPGELTYCSAGPGSINHLAAELFAQMAGVSMTHVPYKGSGPATLDFLAGRTQVFFSTVPTIRAHVREGKVNLLAVTSQDRSAMYPSTPTVVESGLAGYRVATWWGMTVPAGTPEPIIDALNQAINAATPAIQERLVSEGATPLSESPAAFRTMLVNELNAWRQVVRQG